MDVAGCSEAEGSVRTRTRSEEAHWWPRGCWGPFRERGGGALPCAPTTRNSCAKGSQQARPTSSLPAPPLLISNQKGKGLGVKTPSTRPQRTAWRPFSVCVGVAAAAGGFPWGPPQAHTVLSGGTMCVDYLGAQRWESKPGSVGLKSRHQQGCLPPGSSERPSGLPGAHSPEQELGRSRRGDSRSFPSPQPQAWSPLLSRLRRRKAAHAVSAAPRPPRSLAWGPACPQLPSRCHVCLSDSTPPHAPHEETRTLVITVKAPDGPGPPPPISGPFTRSAAPVRSLCPARSQSQSRQG